jgi:hypothetical protein
MNKVLMSLVFGSFVLVSPSFAQNPPPAAAAATADAPAAAAPVAAAPETVKPAHHEHHAELHKAMRKLRGAKDDLQKIAHELGGHKAKAIADIDEALGELKAAMDADKK